MGIYSAPSAYKTLPKLEGTLEGASQWQTNILRPGWRVYPYQLGAMCRASSSGVKLNTYGVGELEAFNYIMVCSKTLYGASPLYVPSTTVIDRIIGGGVSYGTDVITLTNGVIINKRDYVLCLGNDSGGLSPNYDGSTIVAYEDPVGDSDYADGYMLTGQGGFFQAWMAPGTLAVDLLITDPSGTPRVVIPGRAVGPEIAA